MKQYDLDTERVVMVENPDGSYVLASEARDLIHKVAELEKEKKALEDRLGGLELLFKGISPVEGSLETVSTDVGDYVEKMIKSVNDKRDFQSENKQTRKSNHIFYR